MTEDQGIHFCLLGKEPTLAEAIVKAMGPGFEGRYCEELGLSKWGDWGDWCDVILLDLRSDGLRKNLVAGLRLIDEIHGSVSRPPVIVLCDEDDRDLTMQVIGHGAYDTHTNPPKILELRLILQRAFKMRSAEKELERYRAMARTTGRLHELLGNAAAMQELFALVQKIAPCDVNVLVAGETGTGKELLARAIHRMSGRADQPLVAFSCANLPETLIEDELFGHEKGAFTGALMSRRGRLESANQGTLFLDEIGDLSLGLQPKLLRVLQERRFERLGSNTTINVNIRLICATHRNLAEMVQQGKFREDLYYRLNVVQMYLPPLRERRDDIPLLAQHFLEMASQQFNKKVRRLSRPALHALDEYSWPGNVRELENAIQRAVVLSEGQTVDIWHLPAGIRNNCEVSTFTHSYEEEVRQFKRRLLLRTLRECGWRKAESARTLGVARGYLHRLINQLDIRQYEGENPESGLADRVPPSKQIM
jgi:DNA-binding NtrC family response regulator